MNVFDIRPIYRSKYYNRTLFNTTCIIPSTLKERETWKLWSLWMLFGTVCALSRVCCLPPVPHYVIIEIFHLTRYVSREYVSIIIRSERKSLCHEKLVTETFSAF